MKKVVVADGILSLKSFNTISKVDNAGTQNVKIVQYTGNMINLMAVFVPYTAVFQ